MDSAQISDRELLELAAKAAGMNVLPRNKAWPQDAKGWFQTSREGDDSLYSKDAPITWNPLTDDGDALRLAVKLRIQVSPRALTVAAHHWRGSGSVDGGTYSQENYSDREPEAATRRAIVRAAAAIGAKP